MGVNRQDPEENPPGGVAKVELRGSRAILSLLAFPALFPISPRGIPIHPGLGSLFPIHPGLGSRAGVIHGSAKVR